MSNPKKGLALIIANADYQSQPKLLSCKKDGDDMATKLNELNFDVLHYSNTTRNDILDAISKFIQLADCYSVLVMYYTGHGVQIDGENYFVPIGLAEISAGNGTLIAFATAPNTSAICDDSADGNGYYTKRLLEHIDHPNIRIEEMFKMVRKDVVKDTGGQQVPWESTSLSHDFYFSTLTQDDINEQIYQNIRNNYSTETFINLSQHFGYTISDIMRIYQRQKSEKPGGIYFSDEEAFEHFITEQILSLKFEFKNFRWVYKDCPVMMGDLLHNLTVKLSI